MRKLYYTIILACNLFICASVSAQTFEVSNTPDTLADSTETIQTAFNNAGAYSYNTSNISAVRFSTGGRHLLTRPLWINSSKVSFKGNNISLKALYGEGAMLVISPPMAGIPLQNGAWYNDGSNGAWLNLRESKAWDLNGASDFSIEFDMNSSVIYQSGNWIISSEGRELWNDELSSAFQIYTNTYGINAKVNLNGTEHWLHADVIRPNTDYHVALSYTQGMLSLSVDNQVVASEAGTGALKQEFFEDVILGCAFAQFPEQQLYGASTTGTIDNLKLKVNGEQVFYLPFDDSDRIFTRAVTPYGNCWLTLRRNTGGGISDVNVSDVDFGGVGGNPVGIIISGAVKTTVERCRFNYTREAIRIRDNSYLSVLRDISISGARVGIYNYTASGVNLFQNITYGGSGYGIVGQGYKLDHAFLHGQMRYGILASTDTTTSSTLHLDDVHISDEDGADTSKGLIALANIRQFAMVGGQLESVLHPRPLVTISGGLSHSFQSTVFNVHPNQSSIFEFRQNPFYRISLFAPTNCKTGYPPATCSEEGAWTLPSFAAQVSVIR